MKNISRIFFLLCTAAPLYLNALPPECYLKTLNGPIDPSTCIAVASFIATLEGRRPPVAPATLIATTDGSKESGNGKTATAHALAHAIGAQMITVEALHLAGALGTDAARDALALLKEAQDMSAKNIPTILLIENIDDVADVQHYGNLHRDTACAMIRALLGLPLPQNLFILFTSKAPAAHLDSGIVQKSHVILVENPSMPLRKSIITTTITKEPHAISQWDIECFAQKCAGLSCGEIISVVTLARSYVDYAKRHQKSLCYSDLINALAEYQRARVLAPKSSKTSEVAWWMLEKVGTSLILGRIPISISLPSI